MKRSFLSILTLFSMSGVVVAQNVGVGTSSPTEKLEVAGTIYTNEGGIKFPDNTIQTTAAYNLVLPPSSYAVPQGVGFISFDDPELNGPVDSAGLTEVSIVYSMDVDLVNGSSGLAFGDVKILKQTDEASPQMFKWLAIHPNPDAEATIHLTRENSEGEMEVYYRIVLTKVKFVKFNPTLAAGIGGDYVHAELIHLFYETITFWDVESTVCYCYDMYHSEPCPCP